MSHKLSSFKSFFTSFGKYINSGVPQKHIMKKNIEQGLSRVPNLSIREHFLTIKRNIFSPSVEKKHRGANFLVELSMEKCKLEVEKVNDQNFCKSPKNQRLNCRDSITRR